MFEIKNYLPKFINEIPEFNELLFAEQVEINNLQTYADGISNNLNILFCDNNLSRFEQIFGITHNAALSLDARKAKVIAKLNSNGVTTLESIRGLSEIISQRICEISENHNDYSFTVNALLMHVDNAIKANDLLEEIEEIKPAHLACYINQIIEIIKFKNKFMLKLQAISFNVKNNNFDIKCVFLNGMYDLSDGYVLNQEYSGGGVLLKKLVINNKNENKNIVKWRLKTDNLYFLNGTKNLNGMRLLDACLTDNLL